MDADQLETWIAGGGITPAAEAGTRQELESLINELLNRDFARLVQLLYRIDVSESRLRATLAAQPGSDAATLIAALIVERVEEKRRSREQYRRPEGEIPEEERW